jgi:hypothetical protein
MRFLADENFDNDIVRGAMRRLSVFDLLRAQDVGLSGADDSVVLAWAAEQRRVVLTHDARTMVAHACQRIADGLPMPGVLVVRRRTPIAKAVDDLVIVATCSQEGEWENRIYELPFRSSG